VEANPYLEDLLGYPHDEIIGNKLWEIGPFKDVAAAKEAFEKLQHEKYVRYEDLPLQTEDGRRMEVEFVSNVYAVNGAQIIQCNIRDITARKGAEDQLHALRLGLEDRVEERTVELAQANLALQREIVQREHAEARESKVVLEERTRMAREIHDTLAQGFTGIIIQLEVAEAALAAQPEAARLHVLKARTLARESLAEARRSVWALRPMALESDDLGSALLHLVHKLSDEAATPIEFTLRGVLPPLGPDTEHHLLRIGQEALTNALRHAHAPEIRVTLTCARGSLELSVEDDGEGFEVDSPVPGNGLGLRGMQERAEALGGKLTITSAPGQGTQARVVIPVSYGERGSLGDNKPD
jgi:PAS domain S-box-containing protein